MAYTYEEVMSKLGDEAQAVPGAIIVYRSKHIVVAEVGLNGGFSITTEGFKLLEESAEIISETPKKGIRKPKPVDDLDSLDLAD